MHDFAGAALEHFRRPIENLSAQLSALFGPALESGPRSADRVPQILPRSMAHVFQMSAGARLSRQIATALAARKLAANIQRSEEHTSELQSRGHLVCRLLL